jgi:hypothetical protein
MPVVILADVGADLSYFICALLKHYVLHTPAAAAFSRVESRLRF